MRIEKFEALLGGLLDIATLVLTVGFAGVNPFLAIASLLGRL